MFKLYRVLCRHNSGITVVTVKRFSAGGSLDEESKYIACSRCGKILVDHDTLEELTGVIVQEERSDERKVYRNTTHR